MDRLRWVAAILGTTGKQLLRNQECYHAHFNLKTWARCLRVEIKQVDFVLVETGLLEGRIDGPFDGRAGVEVGAFPD
jgi:hypothetical protein